ncbi:MAG: hypothetical protein EOO56_11690 [Hymenobacter sp.]|nr:MAG: hypothetical protein EOO56_11690 [Hymenobacter sp.]
MAIFSIPEPLPSQGCPVPVDDIHASFTLFGFLPIGNTHNSLSPRLVLYADQFEVKIIRADYYKYQDISQVDYLPSRLFRSAQVLLKLDEKETTFFLYLASAAVEQKVINFLQARGVSLSAAAQRALGAGRG